MYSYISTYMYSSTCIVLVHHVEGVLVVSGPKSASLEPSLCDVLPACHKRRKKIVLAEISEPSNTNTGKTHTHSLLLSL